MNLEVMKQIQIKCVDNKKLSTFLENVQELGMNVLTDMFDIRALSRIP